MSSIDYTSAMAVCGCGREKVQVNENQVCIVCDAPKPTSTLRVICEDPGDEKMKQILQSSGVRLPVATNKPNVPKVLGNSSLNEGIKSALSVLSALPMPKDIKQFKQINKIIQLLTELQEGNQNG